MKKHFNIALIAISLTVVGCSRDVDENIDPTADTTADESATAGDSGADVTGNNEQDSEPGTEEETAGETDTGMSEEIETDMSGDNTSMESTDTDTRPVNYGNSVMGILAIQPDLTLIAAAIISADGALDQTLNDPNNTWTVFAANDTALQGVAVDRDVLLAHIHAGFQNTDSLTGLVGSTIGVTSGVRHAVTMADDGVTLQIGGANIVQAGIIGDNGIVYKIDGVLQ